MGLLIDGVWHDQWYDTSKTGGAFKRTDAKFRNWVTADGSAGPTGDGGFKAEPGRYHLYVSYACPWAHRTLMFRKLKNLEKMISVSVVDWFMGYEGWEFSERDGAIPDPMNKASHLHQIYTTAVPDFSGRVTVPVLWDKKRIPLSPMNLPRSSACSIRHSTIWVRQRGLLSRGLARGNRRHQ